MQKKYLEVGEIVTTHGIKGEVRLNPWCDQGDLDGAERLYFEGGARSFEVESVRPHKNIYIVKLSGIDTPEEAVKLRGKTAYMDRADIPLPEGSWFIQDMIGLSVVDIDTGARYGTLAEVASTGANDVYCVRPAEGDDVWIPAIKQVVIETDMDSGELRIRPMKGLFDQ